MKTVTTANIITMIRGAIEDGLKTNGRDSFIYDQDTSFSVSKDFVSASSISVFQNGTPLTTTSDWTFNALTNKVTITSTLVKKDGIIITFSYYEKYSDSEITTYLSSCLNKFVVKRYPKYFYLNDSSEVVTMDGINPTVEEANIMAIITAISIDPNNVNIKTRDFTITAEENESKSEQISRVFSEWMRDFGSTSFLEEE